MATFVKNWAMFRRKGTMSAETDMNAWFVALNLTKILITHGSEKIVSKNFAPNVKKLKKLTKPNIDWKRSEMAASYAYYVTFKKITK